MALRFTFDSGRAQVVPAATDEEDWPQPIRIGLRPDENTVLEQAADLPDGMPVVVRLEHGLSYDLDNLTDIAGAVHSAGRDLVVLLGDE